MLIYGIIEKQSMSHIEILVSTTLYNYYNHSLDTIPSLGIDQSISKINLTNGNCFNLFKCDIPN